MMILLYSKFYESCLLLMCIYLMGQAADCMNIRQDGTRNLRTPEKLTDKLQKPVVRHVTAEVAREVQSHVSCVRDSNLCPYINRTLLSSHGPRIPLNMRSTSPWIKVKNINPNRNPEVIDEACCVCTNCVNLISLERSVHYISTPITVKRQVHIWNGREHVLTHEYINVGCTCAVPMEAQQGDESS